MAAKNASDTTADPRSATEHVRDTLESIVVAFILAFIFRAFIVEAFVIPTGSMAATLYGQQLTVTCSTCGYEYACGIRGEAAVAARNRRASEDFIPLLCPNCNLERDALDAGSVARPASGDRILVHKWPFDLPTEWLGPQRWDIVVFKDPRDGKTNFIKRLVGKPGEVLEIIDGDVYVAPVDELPPEVIEGFETLRKEVYKCRAERIPPDQSRPRIKARYSELNEMILPHLRIQRKTERAQEALWVNVYNHDFLPNYGSLRPDQLTDQRVGWRPVSGQPAAADAWDTTRRTITFNSAADAPLFIRFDGKRIDDLNAYNAGSKNGLHELVGDIRLRFNWRPRKGEGALILETNRHLDRFRAAIHADGTLTLVKERMDMSRKPVAPLVVVDEARVDPFRRSRFTSVELTNVDYRVTLRIDGQAVLSTDDEEYHPLMEHLREMCMPAPPPEAAGGRRILPAEVRIGAARLECDLRHVVLERDVHYRDSAHNPNDRHASEEGPNFYASWPGWGTAGQPILLRRGHTGEDGEYYYGEFFMLGDNSPDSKDSRLWWEVGPHLEGLGVEYQVGTVTRDQLIGKAFFVYWPAGYRWPNPDTGIGLIPNFGDMRWIR